MKNQGSPLLIACCKDHVANTMTTIEPPICVCSPKHTMMQNKHHLHFEVGFSATVLVLGSTPVLGSLELAGSLQF